MRLIKFSAFAGLLYVLVWIFGLFLAIYLPDNSLSGIDLVKNLQIHPYMRVIQTYLIDGVAGILILIFAAGFSSQFELEEGRLKIIGKMIFGAGVAAASISLVQAGFQQLLSNSIFLSTYGNLAGAVIILINQLDTFKLLAIAILIGAGSYSILDIRFAPAWIGRSGYILSALLVLGGFSYIFTNSILNSFLFISLPLLLIWVGGTSLSLLKLKVSQKIENQPFLNNRQS